jgi:hypothetical protein
MTRKELARRSGLGERTVQRALSNLVEAGELVHLSVGRPGRSAVYSFPEETIVLFGIIRRNFQKEPHDDRERGPVCPEREPKWPALGDTEARLTTTEPLDKPKDVLSSSENAERAREVRKNQIPKNRPVSFLDEFEPTPSEGSSSGVQDEESR